MTRLTKTWKNGVVPVEKEKIKKYLQDFIDRFYVKMEQKGLETFNSTYEIIGKLDEEINELSVESHDRNLDLFKMEALDCAIVSFWGYVSANEWKKKSKIT